MTTFRCLNAKYSNWTAIDIVAAPWLTLVPETHRIVNDWQDPFAFFRVWDGSEYVGMLY